ncbi:MAG: methylated-DNA--[protein]-cysteine S-methyltransferase [Armatimonadota bacterium]|nr:methylated-DNA--[protein]-cysteine S-methyltransferase [Armatimonadota bacterium]MCX7777510.1 methylated-DNA--[protein]-cysteine S-methyltransferase [Armatimonadota bacterium]MDW8025986.1 methylated-DNA--[protein]-cysteine S-methyltransferase [Armatimonadota bacterium]
MACIITETVWGYVGISATRFGVARVILPASSKEHVESLMNGAPHDDSDEAKMLAEQSAQALRNYFNGLYDERLRWLPVDLQCVSGEHRKALLKVREVPVGETITYGRLALLIGLRNGARAVGQAMARNPVPIFIPCHRVIRADGGIGGFSFGVEMKLKLLMHERHMTLRDMALNCE